MNIGYDAKRAFLNNTGLGNYSRWLIKAMSAFYPDNRYGLFTPKTGNGEHAGQLEKLKNAYTFVPRGKFSPLWRTKGIVTDLQKNGVELYHGLSHELPLGIRKSGIKSVLTVHDLIFLRFPQYFKLIDRLIYKAKLNYACKAADKIIAISQRTRKDLIELLGVDPNKIEVIYQGCNPAFTLYQSETHRAHIKKTYKLPKRYLLTVGTIEERKNLMLLVKALTLTKCNMPLLVVGKPTPYADEVKRFVEANGLQKRVIFLHQVGFDDLPALYQLSTVFIYPSRYEGFGIPILEAINSGVPVIAATGSCLEEAGGAGSIYVDPDNEQELAKKIDRVWRDTALRQRMIDQGFEYARNFKDEVLAAQYMQVYQNTLQHA
ncbi:glycosyltransferase family 4 protein [Mucilaginibacter daejeonensis]|uniref:glycosyltransferase family 4 protein n=1 Tax=Mucilaginibacter daejeonensis TaxID=398049 RepID=UPI001D1767EF|nr:glycosyltransferase family 1 protein [Mucilaginibacter daejeonensis]UEG52373.1 glycosyltransferase family 4 protein [Mucilaginibacter daejeonensis]